jgi:hypothetical protein
MRAIDRVGRGTVSWIERMNKTANALTPNSTSAILMSSDFFTQR